MGFIPEDVIQQVLERADIVAVISVYVPLKPSGRNFKAACPFHHEKTPSFVVNPDKQIFHCFGCGVGGNVISFVMQQERLSFPEAIRSLAERYAVSLPDSPAPSEEKAEIRRQFKEVMALAGQYFCRRRSPFHDMNPGRYRILSTTGYFMLSSRMSCPPKYRKR